MTARRHGFVLFYTSAAAFRAERLCAEAGIPGSRLVPTPRELSSDCGSALRFALGEAAEDDASAAGAASAVASLLDDRNVPYERIVAE
jgi:hypothetical protein